MANPYSKEDLKKGFDDAFDAVIHYIRLQDDLLFERAESEGKWSTGQQLVHLIKSVEPLNLGLKLPKILLRWRFGTRNRTERTYDATVAKYKAALNDGGRASSPYIPPKVGVHQKHDLLQRYEQEKIKLIRVLDKWNEEQLSKYVAPHPLMGKLTARELIFFTIYHNYHHLESIRKIR